MNRGELVSMFAWRGASCAALYRWIQDAIGSEYSVDGRASPAAPVNGEAGSDAAEHARQLHAVMAAPLATLPSPPATLMGFETAKVAEAAAQVRAALDMQVFFFHGRPVRLVMVDDTPWFLGFDVASELGYARPSDAVSQHCHHTVKRRAVVGRDTRDLLFIPESDVYRLVIRSHLSGAVEFGGAEFCKVRG